MLPRILAFCLFSVTFVHAAGPSCPAGLSLGGIELELKRGDESQTLSLHKVNRMEEGDSILYAPAPRPGEKRRGKVAIVLVASIPQPEARHNFTVLEAEDASKPAEWKVPFRAAVALYVYGPSGLSTRKLEGFLGKDQELIAQLADYAEKTAQTESVLQAISDYERTGATDNLGAALQGFAGQYGGAGRIDRSAPLNEQTMVFLRTLNPALSAWDPIAPSGAQRLSQTAGLATTVAAMFLGSTVGLAAGSTAMALNMKTILFPDSDFRSAYAQSASGASVVLCTSRQPYQTRKRLAYLWAMRLPDVKSPQIALAEPVHVPAGFKSPVRVNSPRTDWKFASRVRDWTLTDTEGKGVAIPVIVIADPPEIELNLESQQLAPGAYKLSGTWDWDRFNVSGTIHVHRLGDVSSAKLTPDSQNRLQPQSGLQVIRLEGADFQFMDKAALIRKGDTFATASVLPFSLPAGPRKGPQNSIELQVDTASLTPGTYSLQLQQAGSQTQSVDIDVVEKPPVIRNLPLSVHQGERETTIVLEGEGLDRLVSLEAEGLTFEMTDESTPHRRALRVRQNSQLTPGSILDLRVSLKGYGQPVVFERAVAVKGERPAIREVTASLPADVQVMLRPGELPAGAPMGLMLQVSGAGSQPAIRLTCSNVSGQLIDAVAGAENNGIRLNTMQPGTLFLSLDPGKWPSGCNLSAVLRNEEGGESEARELGRVLKLPRIDEFRLTDETAGDGSYAGILTGRDLELIGKTGWTPQSGHDVQGLPAAVPGDGGKQSLSIRMSWPSPTPRAPLVIWLRGEDEGRLTTVRSGS